MRHLGNRIYGSSGPKRTKTPGMIERYTGSVKKLAVKFIV